MSGSLRELEYTTSQFLEIYGRSLALLLKLRRRREEMGRIAETFVRSGAPPDAARRLASLDEELGAEDGRLEQMLRDPEQIARWRASADTRAAFAARLLDAVGHAAAGEHAESESDLRRAKTAAADIDHEAEALTTADARRMRALADVLDRRLDWTLWLNLLVVGLGGAAAIGLLRAALAALRDYASEVQRRIEELDLFAGRIAHDIRQPLNSLSLVIGSAERSAIDDRLRRALALGRQTIHRLDEMTEDMLAFSRSTLARGHPTGVSVQPIAEEVAEELQRRPGFDSVQWHFAYAPDAPDVAMTPGNLRSVLWNLLDNAVKYLPERGDRRIGLSIEGCLRGCRICVRDTGPGIPREELVHVFEPFKRGTTSGSGHGLGLATVKRLVEAHGGVIGIESSPNQGTVFTVELPRVQA